MALAPADIGGVTIDAGEKAVCLIASANRDETRFADAQSFDHCRFMPSPDRQYTAAGDILPFGAGEHHCAGSKLAQAEIVQALRQLMARAERVELVGPAPSVGRLVLFSPATLPVVLHPA